MLPHVVAVHNVTKSYASGAAQHEVLRGVSLSIGKGEIAAIVGASGAGKSTLLHIMGALDHPSAGSVEIGGRDLLTMPDAERAAFRNANVGFVFQFHHLLPEFSAAENIALPALIAGKSRSEAEARARALLELVHVAHRGDARPSELSGGEQQRVAVARALANEPQVVLADEPSGNLDEENADALHALLWSLAKERGQTFVIVTHDEGLAKRADALYRLHDGALARER
ncbi:MAG: ABC transporter ATP-binding protein [Ignavibacteria bacterium]|nr:ABC transporter ATP-binding protein [Ignavibacteria bacterium]